MRSCDGVLAYAKHRAPDSATTPPACPPAPTRFLPCHSASLAKLKLMIDLGRLFDSYNRQARLYPALVALLPPLITVFAWYPELLTSNAAATALTVVTSCGFLYGLMTFSRSRGKNVE